MSEHRAELGLPLRRWDLRALVRDTFGRRVQVLEQLQAYRDAFPEQQALFDELAVFLRGGRGGHEMGSDWVARVVGSYLVERWVCPTCGLADHDEGLCRGILAAPHAARERVPRASADLRSATGFDDIHRALVAAAPATHQG